MRRPSVADLVEGHVQTFRQETLINAAAVVLDNPHRSDRSRYCSEAVWHDTRAFMPVMVACWRTRSTERSPDA